MQCGSVRVSKSAGQKSFHGDLCVCKLIFRYDLDLVDDDGQFCLFSSGCLVCVANSQRGKQELGALGRQVILEYYGCPSELLNDRDFVEEALVEAAKEMRATLISVHFHKFNPHGISGAIVISESHLTIHTWPEYGYAALDVFTCGNVIDPWTAHSFLKSKFQPQRDSFVEFKRGIFDVPTGTLPSCYGVQPDSDQKMS